MEKSCSKCVSKASPRTCFYFGKKPNTAIGCKKFFLKLDILKGIIKNLLKSSLYFSFEPSPFLMDKVIKINGAWN